jgi:hypothetical protein
MDLNYLKKQLPIGAETEIAKMANVSVPSVKKVLYQLKVKPEIELKVLDALAKYIKDYKEKKATALQELQAVASA